MDRDLSQQLAEGKVSALQDVFESFYGLLMRQAREARLTPEKAEGVIHQIFLELWESGGPQGEGDSTLDYLQKRMQAYIEEEKPQAPTGELEAKFRQLPEGPSRAVGEIIWQGEGTPGKDKKSRESLFGELRSAFVLLEENPEGEPSAFTPEEKHQILVLRYLADDLSLTEENDLRHWVDQEDEHAEYFERMYELWEGIKALPGASEAPPHVSWKRLEKSLLSTQTSKESNKKVGRFSLQLALGVMVIITVLTTLGVWVTRWTSNGDLADLPSPDIILETSTLSLVLDGKRQNNDSLTKGFILNPSQKASWDSLKVSQMGSNWIFSLEKGEVLLRSSTEQVRLEGNYLIYYNPDQENFLWKKPIPRKGK